VPRSLVAVDAAHSGKPLQGLITSAVLNRLVLPTMNDFQRALDDELELGKGMGNLYLCLLHAEPDPTCHPRLRIVHCTTKM
jgi:hypothetical protein